MYLLNIFINIMFKSTHYRIWLIAIVLACSVKSGFAAGIYDTLNVAEPAALSDSTMIYLESAEFNRILDKAILYQNRADSLYRISIEMRKEAARMDDPVSRGQYQKKIIRIEDSVLVLRSLANEQFLILAEGMPGNQRGKSIHPFLVKDTVLNGITVYKYDLSDEFMARLDEIRKSPETGSRAQVVENSGISTSKTSITKSALSPGGIHISETSPYGPGKPFERNYTVPPGVFYRIQLAVYRKELPADHFGGLSPITTEYIPERELTRYFAGKFKRMDNAKEALVKVRAMGYSDAFIIGYYNGAKASFSKLKALEN